MGMGIATFIKRFAVGGLLIGFIGESPKPSAQEESSLYKELGDVK